MNFTGKKAPANLDESSARAFAVNLHELLYVVTTLPNSVLGYSITGAPLDVVVTGPGGGNAQLTGGAHWVSYDFHNYGDSNGHTLNGRLTAVARNSNLSDALMEFTALRVARQGVDFSLTGSSNHVPGPASTQGVLSTYTVNVVMTDTSTSASSWAENVVIDQTQAALHLSQSYGGRFYRAADGYVDLRTTHAQDLELPAEFAETGGVVVLKGANGSAGVAPAPGRHLGIALDANNDGAFEQFARLSWDQLTTASGQASAYVDTHSPPTANAGANRTINVGETFEMFAAPGQDADGSFQSAEWRLVLKPLGSTAQLDMSTPLPTFTPDVFGNYLFTVHVHEPDGDAYDSFVLNASSIQNFSFERMALDRPRERPLGTSVPLDASLSLHRDGLGDVHWLWDLKAPYASTAALTSTTFSTSTLVPDVAGFYQITVGDDYAASLGVTTSFGVGFDFYRPAVFSTHTQDYSPLAGDFDGDGKTDIASLVALASDVAGFALYHALGSGAYSAFSFSLEKRANSNLAAGDLDGDGRREIAVVTETDVVVVHPLAAPTIDKLPFARSSACTNGYLTLSISDANADGRPDLIAVDACEGKVTTWLQNTNHTLASPTTQSVPQLSMWTPAVGDLNHDGRADIAVPFASDGKIVVLLGNSSGGFTVSRTFTSVPSMRVLIADITGDSLPDLLLADGNNVGVIAQLANGTLGAPLIRNYTVNGADAPLAVGDFDNNGLPDIFVMDGYNAVFGLQRTAGVFEFVHGPYLAEHRMCFGSIADLDGDGRLDVVCGRGSGVGDMEVWFGAPR